MVYPQSKQMTSSLTHHNLSPPSHRYQAGDVAVLFPCNSGDGGGSVARLAARCEVTLDAGVEIRLAPGARGPSLYPPHCTVRQLLDEFLDIYSVPKRSALEQLSFFASDEEQREK